MTHATTASSTTAFFRFLPAALAVALLAALGAAPAAHAQGFDEVKVFDDFEAGNAGDSNQWFAFDDGSPGEVTDEQITDTPSENGGEFALAITDQGDVGGGITGLTDSVEIDTPDEAFFNFYIKSDSDVELKMQLEDRDAGELFQVFYTATSDDWERVSMPLSDFSFVGDGDAPLLDRFDKIYIEPQDNDGPVTFSVDYFSITEGGALPVEMTSFTATPDGRDAVLRWSTASETNNAGFRVFHAAPSASFEKVDFVEGHGTTNVPQDYRFRLEGLAHGTHRFQLQQIDTDAEGPRTEVVQATISTGQRALLEPRGPNPFQAATTLRFSSSQSGPVHVALYDARGRQVRTLHEGTLAAGASGEVRIRADGLASGLYFVRLRTADGATDTESVTLVK